MVLKNKKTLKLVVCMSLIVALAISALGISVWASFENTHNNSGNQASDIVGVAETQVGYSEGYDGYTKYGDWYGLPNSDWCAMFVSWCANQAGVDNSVFPSFALCSAGCDWFIQQGRFHYSGSYTPQAGDLIFYSSYGDIYHVGLVTGSDGSNVYSIEGNYNEQVCNVSYSLYYGDILGYATPDYTKAGADSGAVVQDVFDASENVDEPVTDYYDDEEDSDLVDEDTEVIVASDVDYVKDTETDVNDDEDSDLVEDADTDTETDTDIETDTETVDSEVEEADSDAEPESHEYDDVIMGDVNGDGVITSFDALLVQRYLALGDSEYSTLIELKAM